MQKSFIRILIRVALLLGSAQTSWADQAQVYYTYDPAIQLENIKTRTVPTNMTAQQFLDTLQPSLPPLDTKTVWALATKDLARTRPNDTVVVHDGFHQVGRSSDNPWVITKVAVG